MVLYLGREIAADIDPEPSWRERDDIPPAGRLIWVTDGADIWLLEATGIPFPKAATACRWWTLALIPSLPSSAPPHRIED